MREVIAYIRTSTKEQTPELQLNDIKRFCQERGLKYRGCYREQVSAFKETERPVWDKCVEHCIHDGSDLILWRFDRSFRNRLKFVKFMMKMHEYHKLRVYSVKEPSLQMIWDMMDQAPEDEFMSEVFNDMVKFLWKFMIRFTGEQAEEESRKKSERIKLAIRRDGNSPTKSYRGNKWGRKRILNTRIIKQIKELREQGMSIRKIADKVIYYDKNRNPKKLSKSAIHKILNDTEAMSKANDVSSNQASVST